MKLNKILAPVALAASALFAGHASAALIYSGTVSGGANTYLGTYNPGAEDVGLFNHNMGALGSFDDLWVFNISPAGLATMNANFVPTANIAGFTARLYAIAAGGSCAGAAGTACGAAPLGALLATGVPGIASSNIGFNFLTAGLYGIRVTGTVNTLSVLYSGQLATQKVPEPGSLALIGAAMIGLVAVRKRRKQS